MIVDKVTAAEQAKWVEVKLCCQVSRVWRLNDESPNTRRLAGLCTSIACDSGGCSSKPQATMSVTWLELSVAHVASLNNPMHFSSVLPRKLLADNLSKTFIDLPYSVQKAMMIRSDDKNVRCNGLHAHVRQNHLCRLQLPHLTACCCHFLVPQAIEAGASN